MKNIRMDMIFEHSSDVVARVIDDTLIIVPLTAGMGDMEDDLFSMNETGAAIWNMLDGRKTLAEVAAALTAEYEADQGQIERDVAGIAGELSKRRMIAEVAAE